MNSTQAGNQNNSDADNSDITSVQNAEGSIPVTSAMYSASSEGPHTNGVTKTEIDMPVVQDAISNSIHTLPPEVEQGNGKCLHIS